MLAVCRKLPVFRPRKSTQLATLLASLPVFALLLALNIAYGYFLREWLRPKWLPPHEPTPWTYFTLVTMILQPAVIEELFFRYLALGVLRQVTGTHAAVFVSSVMFALAHIYNPFGIPYLLICGLFLGYLRVAGTIFLPMFFHGLHNAIVIYLEGVF
jgi:CAAX protease family protein